MALSGRQSCIEAVNPGRLTRQSQDEFSWVPFAEFRRDPEGRGGKFPIAPLFS
nr:MAG TPA: hypothetical protein [Caudoviricetes sp.]